MCKRVLSRGSERTLAGRTRGCGGLFQEEIQEVGGPEENSDSQYRDWRRDEISLEKLWCMTEGLIKKESSGEKQGVKTREMIHSFFFFLVPFSSAEWMGPLLKLSSSSAVFTLTTELTQWLITGHVTAQWIHLFTQPDNCANRYWLHCASAWRSSRTVEHPPEH